MRTVLAPAVLAAVFLHSASAFAQDDTTAPPPPPPAATTTNTAGPADPDSQGATFRGIRVEGDIGWDRFSAEGGHHNKLGYGGTVGFDGQYHRFVLGAEGSFWRANDGSGVCQDYSAGTLCRSSYNEWGAAVRAGYLVTPQLLVFGKGGYVNNHQHVFAAPAGGPASLYRFNTDGYQVGGGVEYSMPMMNVPFYLNAQYVRSQYDDHTHRDRVMAGVGVRFK